MRDNTNIVLQEDKPVTTIEMNSISPFDIADFDLTKEKEVRQYFFTIERIVRGSYLYKHKLIPYLRDYVNMNECSFYKNINNIDTFSMKIHIHHSPLTLFDIVNTVFNKRCKFKEPINVNLVAKEVMWLHYRMQVGLIPLSETVHELTHNGFLFIPTNKVYGLYRDFVRMYGEFIDPQTMSTLKQAEEYTKSYDFAKETKVLNMNMIHLDTTGSYEFPKLEDVVQMLKESIDKFDSKVSSVQFDNRG